MDGRTFTDPWAWAQETFGAAELGDPRRTRRLVRVAAQVAADPQGSLPREMGGDWAALKAAYRLVRADGVTHEAISRPVWQQTRQQVEQEPGVVLLVHDDTQVDYGYRRAISGLGPIGNGTHRGFLVHTVLALVPRGESERVLGLLHQEAWVRHPAARRADGRKQSSRERRERPRESEVWTRAVEQVGSPPQGQVWIHVGDRYADMFAFLQRCLQMGTFFLVRAAQNRRVLGEEEQAEPEPPRCSSVGHPCTCFPLRKAPLPNVLPCRSGWYGCGSPSLLASRKPSGSLCPATNMAPTSAGSRRARRWKPWNGFCSARGPWRTVSRPGRRSTSTSRGGPLRIFIVG